jgi:fermentation-respiration switch protein FrsA (DUF1100 family)
MGRKRGPETPAMREVISYLLLLVYGAAPVAVLLLGGRLAGRARRPQPLVSAILAWLSGITAGIILIVINVRLMDGRMTVGEGARLIYFAIGVCSLLALVDYALRRLAFGVARVPVDPGARPLAPVRLRALLALLAQRVVMLLLVIIIAGAALIAYRPKVRLAGDPASLGLAYAAADFRALDGVELAGWWFAAAKPSRDLSPEDAALWGKRAVLLCHGVGSGKEQMLTLARALADRGLNVMVFDFRAHGESGGNFLTYGDRERLDVLGAAQWVKTNHSAESEQLFGLGVNTGAAALVAAAADLKVGGAALDALVLYEPYARFDELAGAASRRSLPWGVATLVSTFSVPLASLHSAGRLGSFAPADLIDRVWPRPILVVHGQGGSFIPTAQSMELFQRASPPRRQFWPAENYTQRYRAWRKAASTRAGLLTQMFREYIGAETPVWEDGGVMYQTLRFLREAQEVPAL